MPQHEPDYMRIVADLQTRIRAGELKPGEKLPSYDQLATQYEVGITTVSTALRTLSHLGWTVGRQGKGVFVANPVPE